MLLRRRFGTDGGASLCVLRAALRHTSSSNNNNDKNNDGSAGNKGDGHRRQLFQSAPNSPFPPREESWATPGAPTSSSSASASAGFKGWKRFDLARDADVTTTAATGSTEALPPPDTSAHSVVDQKRAQEEAHRRAASARLADMFVESERHVQWIQEQHQRAAPSQHYQEDVSSVRRVVPQQQQQQATAAVVRSNIPNYAYDEDSDGVTSPEGAIAALAPATPTDVLEQELLDDNFLYYPSSPALRHGDGIATAAADPPCPDPAKERYVPGQQIIPPGFTRYRVEVQYQGSDFDGWYKSVQRTRPPMKSEGSRTNDLAEGGSRHYARTVLEEALAVALDVASVTVVAAAIPETGVSVRRLTCHVDVASEVELQPRTILQRATLWLHQRHQPLAFLSCHPCANQNFHARHSGVRRVYCYRILNRIAPPLFDAGLQWHVDRYLDVARMQRMAKALEGTHDYGYFADPKMANALRRAAAHTGGGPVVSSAYSPEHEPLLSHGLLHGQVPAAPKVAIDRGLSQLERAAALPTFNEYGQRVVTYQAKPREYFKAHTNLPTVRTVDKIDVVRQEDEVLIWFVGRSFLRHQIRNMVAVLKAGGHGLWDDQELQHALQSGFEVSRKKFARERLPAAPVHGLTLWDVEYPAQHAADYVPYVDAGPYEPLDVSAQH
ncbi:tRNA pseudouridine synthase A-like protein [Leptomonas pyrrhocoris]|uniref:tRNA pseudouridine synthase A-like protein n=1 Tax=Leptomonas pyrrhocoris TaxID=157538 RepID=A0A0N0DXD9_LEPPY|nr:tRNA pseudouridine synthase A-like protein [Leptomonas pyrrhocoris]KPA82865.1 tRNA pseudouridine synthase A-like protein [Leptomonas pyrrhocoris]|eukprot:XP_015661304.1 tRNA pseudouridine synthase A-like protein [Leptomonas pyrrhocoris]